MSSLLRFQSMASDRLNDIAEHLPEGMEMALVAYRLGSPGMDIVMASGRLEDVRATIERRIIANAAPKLPATTRDAGDGEVRS